MPSHDLLEYLSRPMYHGSGGVFRKPKMPAFFTDDIRAASWFSYEHGDGPPMIYEAMLDISNPLDARTKEGMFAFFEIASRAGVSIETSESSRSWTFYSKDISRYSPSDGYNPVDLMYIPKVRRALERDGYDGLVAWDALGNKEILAFLPVRSDQINVLNLIEAA